ncbi:hypothetical protein B0H16DRAFT_344275 [Mycena metata]|uniref:Uncharacterized protein n=1 Tax=Mycena metata TaxID=1033252 RepID=A0AAD7MML1_9AGAR|nr:hypothetical protein B0H16DRAFT_344275 [Mycena metata]
MPASNSKDRVTYIAVRELPPHLSKESFEAKVRAVVDSFLVLPVCKKNLLRYDLVGCDSWLTYSSHLTRHQIFHIPSEWLNAALRALGLPESRPHVLSIAECESYDHWAEILTDPDFGKVTAEGEKFGYCSGARAFFADVATKIDSSAAGLVDPICLFAVCRAPTRIPAQEYFQKLDKLVDRALALPVCKKVFNKYSIHLSSNADKNLQNIDGMLRALGIPALEPMAVLITEASVRILLSLPSLR